MNFKALRKKMWVKLFARISAIFAVFVGVLFLANSTLLPKYYEYSESLHMKALAEKIDEIDLYSPSSAEEISEVISGSGGYSLIITDSFSNIMFISADSPVADYKGFSPEIPKPHLKDELKKEGFSALSRNGESYFVYSALLSGGERLELSLRASILKSSAKTANEFIFIIASICLVLTLVWVLYSAKKFSSPIAEMKGIAENMARLDFSKKVAIKSEDEIGELAAAINILSGSLEETLKDLNKKNALLLSEIEAERKIDEMRKGFIANVSHELKTPISIISGYAEGIKLIGNDAERRDEYAEIIVGESARMNELVLSLLELSRLESGGGNIEKQSYNISEQLAEISRRFEGGCREKNVRLSLQIPESLPVFADMGKMAQVIYNYLSNALSHTRSGGEIIITAESLENSVKINVYNSGERIKKENMEHIWESFWRGEESHKRDKERFGLGLSIVKALISLHGTSCGVRNSQEGVNFWFTADKQNN